MKFIENKEEKKERQIFVKKVKCPPKQLNSLIESNKQKRYSSLCNKLADTVTRTKYFSVNFEDAFE